MCVSQKPIRIRLEISRTRWQVKLVARCGSFMLLWKIHTIHSEGYTHYVFTRNSPLNISTALSLAAVWKWTTANTLNLNSYRIWMKQLNSLCCFRFNCTLSQHTHDQIENNFDFNYKVARIEYNVAGISAPDSGIIDIDFCLPSDSINKINCV